MRPAFSALAVMLFSVTACGQSRPSSVAADAMVNGAAPVAAVLVFAEWCGSCKVLDPKVEAAREMVPHISASFIVLDYTDRDTDTFFRQADAAGVGAPIRAKFADGVKTGQLLLIDRADMTITDTITRDASEEDIRDRILAAAS